MSQTVNLVANPDIIRKFFPDARDPLPGFKPGIMSADFPINPADCETKLGRWLAEQVFTTRRDDDASRVRVLVPVTNAGALLANLGKSMLGYKVTSQDALDRVIAAVRHGLTEIENQIQAYGQHEFNLRCVDFEWPVFGSRAGGIDDGIDTPEKFFDFCGRKIRQLDGVVLSAGLAGARPPESILRTMHDGRGLLLLSEYEKQLAR